MVAAVIIAPHAVYLCSHFEAVLAPPFTNNPVSSHMQGVIQAFLTTREWDFIKQGWLKVTVHPTALYIGALLFMHMMEQRRR